MGDPASPGGLPLVYGGCAWPPAAGRTGVRWYCGPWNHSADQTAAPCEPGRRSGGGGETKGAKTGHEGPARPKWEKSLWWVMLIRMVHMLYRKLFRRNSRKRMSSQRILGHIGACTGPGMLALIYWGTTR